MTKRTITQQPLKTGKEHEQIWNPWILEKMCVKQEFKKNTE
jgi:hypothetical protein